MVPQYDFFFHWWNTGHYEYKQFAEQLVYPFNSKQRYFLLLCHCIFPQWLQHQEQCIRRNNRKYGSGDRCTALFVKCILLQRRACHSIECYGHDRFRQLKLPVVQQYGEYNKRRYIDPGGYNFDLYTAHRYNRHPLLLCDRQSHFHLQGHQFGFRQHNRECYPGYP